jgi:transcriptional regulator with XRE-family HTH domain
MLELKILLLRRGLTQPELASQLGITKQYLNDILHGKRKALHVRSRLVHEFGFPEHLVEWRSELRSAA